MELICPKCGNDDILQIDLPAFSDDIDTNSVLQCRNDKCSFSISASNSSKEELIGYWRDGLCTYKGAAA